MANKVRKEWSWLLRKPVDVLLSLKDGDNMLKTYRKTSISDYNHVLVILKIFKKEGIVNTHIPPNYKVSKVAILTEKGNSVKKDFRNIVNVLDNEKDN